MNRSDFEDSLAYLQRQADKALKDYREFHDEFDNGCYQGYFNGMTEVRNLLSLYDAN